MHRRDFLMGVVAIGCVIGHIGPAAARGARRFRGRAIMGRGSYGGDVLTPDELEACLRMNSDIDGLETDVHASKMRIEQAASEVDRLGSEIDVRATTLNRYSQADVDDYNLMVDRHQKLVQAYNGSLPAHNARIFALNGRVDAFNRACAEKNTTSRIWTLRATSSDSELRIAKDTSNV